MPPSPHLPFDSRLLSIFFVLPQAIILSCERGDISNTSRPYGSRPWHRQLQVPAGVLIGHQASLSHALLNPQANTSIPTLRPRTATTERGCQMSSTPQCHTTLSLGPLHLLTALHLHQADADLVLHPPSVGAKGTRLYALSVRRGESLRLLASPLSTSPPERLSSVKSVTISPMSKQSTS